MLEDALKAMIAKPPKPSDIAGMTRLLTLRQAVLAMKRVATDDSQRAKVLKGVKGLMDSGKTGAKRVGADGDGAAALQSRRGQKNDPARHSDRGR